MPHNQGFLSLVNDAKTRINEAEIHEVKQWIDNGDAFILVDVREESEWNGGRLPNAIHLGKGIIERDIETHYMDKNTPLVLYCGGGYRSALAADNLQKMGYERVISVNGGIRAWKEAGYPIVQ